MNIANEIAIALTKKIEAELVSAFFQPTEYGGREASSSVAPQPPPSFYQIRETIYRTLQPYFKEAAANAYVHHDDFRMERGGEEYKRALDSRAHQQLTKLAMEYVTREEWDSYINEGVRYSLIVVDTKEVMKHKEQK